MNAFSNQELGHEFLRSISTAGFCVRQNQFARLCHERNLLQLNHPHSNCTLVLIPQDQQPDNFFAQKCYLPSPSSVEGRNLLSWIGRPERRQVDQDAV